MKKKILIFIYLLKLLNKNIFFINKIKFFKKLVYNINKLYICLNCHNSFNYINEIGIYKIPKIINQNKNYIENSLLSYKFLLRKSKYMNIISKFLNLNEINKISLFFFNYNEL